MRDSARRDLAGLVAAAMLFIAGVSPIPASSGEKTSLWKVSDGEHTVYLLGSIHLLKEDDYPLDARIDRAFDEADVAVFEVDPDSLESPSLQSYVMRNALLGEGETLSSVLGDSVYAVASARAESLGVDLGPMRMFRPWFVSITLALVEMQRMDFDPALGVEMHYAAKAKAAGKTILGLETGEYQLGLFVALSAEEQRDLLLHTLSQLADIEKGIGAILAAWRTGDLENLEGTLNRSFKEFPGIRDSLVTQRNRRWIARVADFLRDGRTHIVIVGVGHMPGEEGLIALLEKKGLTVEQL